MADCAALTDRPVALARTQKRGSFGAVQEEEYRMGCVPLAAQVGAVEREAPRMRPDVERAAAGKTHRGWDGR